MRKADLVEYEIILLLKIKRPFTRRNLLPFYPLAHLQYATCVIYVSYRMPNVLVITMMLMMMMILTSKMSHTNNCIKNILNKDFNLNSHNFSMETEGNKRKKSD